MKRRRILLFISIALLCGFSWAANTLPRYVVGIHQQNVVKELLQWKNEFGTIESGADALRAARIMEYIQRYYVVGEGYRGTPESEAALESQRRDTIDTFVKSLREYTHKDFGEDAAKWRRFLVSYNPRKNRLPE